MTRLAARAAAALAAVVSVVAPAARADGAVVPRIVNGGTIAAPQAAPWVVRISVGGGKPTFDCGGSLIDAGHVLTAAHCAFAPDGSLRPAATYSIVAGVASIASGADDSHRQERSVSSVRVHPGYSPLLVINDVAELTLSTPFDVTTGAVAAIAPVGESAGGAASAPTPLRIVGWGDTVAGGGSNDRGLHTLDLTMRPGWACDPGLPSLLCGIPPVGSSTCFGDSGSGLVTLEPVPRLAAVHSGQVSAPACQLDGTSRDVDLASPEVHEWLAGNAAPATAPRTVGRAHVQGANTVGETLTCDPPPWQSAATIDGEFVDGATGASLASGSRSYVLQAADVGRAVACVSLARSPGGVTGAISDNAVAGIGRRPTLTTPTRLPAARVGRPLSADAGATANDGRSITASGWDVTGDGVIDQPGGHLRLIPRRRGPLTVAFVASDDAGASASAALVRNVGAAPRIGVLLATSSRRAILRRGIRASIRRPPSGLVVVTVSVGRLRAGRLRAAASQRLRLGTTADVPRGFRLAPGRRLRSALRRRGAVLRIRADASGYALPSAQITQRLRS